MKQNLSTKPLIIHHCASPSIPDWHQPRNPDCPQNGDATADCKCRRERNRKPYREVRVTDPEAVRLGGTRINPRLVIRLWPNGVITIREHGRRTEIATTARSVYQKAVFAEAMRKAGESAKRRGSKKGKTKSAKRQRTRRP